MKVTSPLLMWTPPPYKRTQKVSITSSQRVIPSGQREDGLSHNTHCSCKVGVDAARNEGDVTTLDVNAAALQTQVQKVSIPSGRREDGFEATEAHTPCWMAQGRHMRVK